MTVNKRQYCICMTRGALSEEDAKRLAGYRATLLNDAKWLVGYVITVRFLEGAAELQQRVREVANEWTRLANLTFDFRTSGPTDIRIAFRKGNSSWCYLGRMCRQVPEPEPTMNFGWLTPDSPEDELWRVVLHEFGHALGLTHEHPNPTEGDIVWNRAAVIADLSGPPNYWGVAAIEQNMFQKYQVGVVAAEVDRGSIMSNPIPLVWTLNGSSAGLNSDLSSRDRAFILKIYPREQPAPSGVALEPYDDELRIGGVGSEPRDVDRRTVNVWILQGGQRRNTFRAGAENIIRCWIGLPDRDATSADQSIPNVFIPHGGLPLLVQLYWRDGSGRDHTDSKPMLLPAERTARSGDCDLQLHVPEGERYVRAEVMFRFRGRAFEVVIIEAFAIAPNEADGSQYKVLVRSQTSRRETIEVPDSQPVGATFVFGDERSRSPENASPPASSSLRVFGRERVTHFDLGDASEAISWLNETLFATEKLVVRRRAAQGPASVAGGSGSLPEDVLDTDDQDVCKLLRDMARHGAGLYNHLAAEGFVDPGERIQVLNHEPNTYVPLEFVYDRGYPVGNAKVCAAGLEALKSDAGACPVCTVPAPDEERANAPVICPFGFWSIRKVIERVALGVSGKASTPRAGRRGLPVLDSVAFASSHLVPEEERKATQEALEQSFGRLFLADDWSQWREAMKERPSLLLLMPHHGIQAKLDYLEIGAEHLPEDLGKLSRAQLLRQYVNVDGRDPGPIVLLLGCQTAAKTETGYVQITQLIQEQHASIVLGTLSEILGRHAAPVARELVAELVAIKDTQADFGTVMRRVRRRMLARGYLMALCLVALGDAEWRLTPRPDSGHP